MKLSMWMIANRLSPLMDIATNIRMDAKPILNSARVAYSTNTAHVYQSGRNVIVEGEGGDHITLFDIHLKEAFEIIQGVFDYYQDWETEMEEAIADGDYQRAVDTSWLVFNNPMMILDGNSRLLAITRDPELGKMDPEWDYLCKYGYSSLNSIRAMRYDNSSVDFTHYGSQSFQFQRSSTMLYGGISYCMIFNEGVCGRITLLEKNRKLNAGDSQLIERLAKLLEPRLGRPSPANNSHVNVFFKLLSQQPYSEKELAIQLAYYQWLPEDPYQLCTIKPTGDSGEMSLHILSQTISRHLQNAIVLEKGGCVHVICNRDMYNDPVHQQFREILLANNSLRIAFSLCVPNVNYLPLLERQTAFVLSHSNCSEPGVYTFADHGLNFLLSGHSAREVYSACHPVVIALWEKARNGNGDLYDTLKTYIDCERSLSQTAAALYTHRNTVLYRIRKCQEMLGDDLDTPAKRLYIRISMQALELYGDELKKKS
ncbi:MAG: helix-turn-helix domain-containing protein [Clostridia bacterium]|nr:helix-turn-helix domain-containing protein [Clostridia bacterium]